MLTMARPKFEVFKDQSNEYRFRLKAPNGEIIATSEGYTAKASCFNGIESVKKNAPIAAIVELFSRIIFLFFHHVTVRRHGFCLVIS